MPDQEFPSWMKPHLRARLLQEKADKERTGPKQGEPALVATDKGKIKTVTTDHKPATPKNGFRKMHEGVSPVRQLSFNGNSPFFQFEIGQQVCCLYDGELFGAVRCMEYKSVERETWVTVETEQGRITLKQDCWREEQENRE